MFAALLSFTYSILYIVFLNTAFKKCCLCSDISYLNRLQVYNKALGSEKVLQKMCETKKKTGKNNKKLLYSTVAINDRD